jgi:hypothetical protein
MSGILEPNREGCSIKNDTQREEFESSENYGADKSTY